MGIVPVTARAAAERTYCVCSSLSALWQMKTKHLEISADFLLTLGTEIHKDQV